MPLTSVPMAPEPASCATETRAPSLLGSNTNSASPWRMGSPSAVSILLLEPPTLVGGGVSVAAAGVLALHTAGLVLVWLAYLAGAVLEICA